MIYIIYIKEYIINTMFSVEDFKDNLFYEQETGNFYWVNPKPGRPKGRPAGTVTPKGYTIITYHEVKFQAHHLAWFYMTGEWPEYVGFRDGNPRNLRWDNLVKRSKEETYDHIKIRAKESELMEQAPTKVIGRKPTFTNKEVTQVVEEFIKDKQLVNGRYV